MVFLLFLFVMPISLISSVAYSDEGDKAKYFKRPVREISIILTKEGYFPNKVVAHEGEQVRFFLTSTLDQPECFVVEDHKVFLSATKGKISEAQDVFRQAGKYKFYCPSSKHKGHITVIGNNEQKREVASEKPAYWLPRDYD